MLSPQTEPGTELVTWLGALRRLSASATAEEDLSHVLAEIAETARSLLGFDFCGVLLPDEQSRHLRVRGASGLSSDYVDRVNSDRPLVLHGGSPSSRAFHTAEAVAIRDVTAEPGFELWAGIANEQGYRSMIAVPLVARGEVLGTLNGYYGAVHTYTRFEVERMTLLANHAAIAVSSARRLDELRALTASLRRQRDALTRSEQIHDQLLAVTLRSGGLDGIAAVLQGLIGRPILIDDIQHEVLACSVVTTDFPDTTWRAAAEAGTGSSPVPVGQFDGTTYLASAVHLGDEVAARIWFPETSIDLDPIMVRAVEHASIVTALELLRCQTAAEVEQRLRGELLSDVLSSGAALSDRLLDRAHRLGHDLTVPHIAIVGAFTGLDPVAERRAYERSLVLLAKESAAHRPKPVVAMHAGTIVMLWPAQDAADAAGAGEVVRQAMRAASADRQATVAVGPGDVASHRESYQTAKGALQVAIMSGRTAAVVGLDDLGIAGLLLRINDPAALSTFARRTLAPILDYDHAHRTELLVTLRAYLECRQERSATATRLVIHPNTVAQRLRRIESLCSVTLTDPAVILQFSAALTVYDIAALD